MDLEIDEEAYDIVRTLQGTEDQGTFLGYQLDFLDGYTEEPRVPKSAIGPSRNGMDVNEETPDVVQAEDQENADIRERGRKRFVTAPLSNTVIAKPKLSRDLLTYRTTMPARMR